MPIEYVVLVQKKKHMAAVRFWTILSHFGGKTHGSSARVNQIIFGGKNLAAVVFLPRKSTKMLPSLKSLECEIFYSTCKCQISQRTRFSVSILSISANSSGVGPDWKANNQIKFCIQHGGNIIDFSRQCFSFYAFSSYLRKRRMGLRAGGFQSWGSFWTVEALHKMAN